MKKFLQYSAVTALLVLLFSAAGCVLTPRSSREVKTFDLNPPQKSYPQSDFVLAPFRNHSPARTRMLYRQQNNRIIQDEYNCWVQPPELMLNRKLNLIFPQQSQSADSDPRPGSLRLDLLAFEFDLQSSEAVLSFNYTCEKHDHRCYGTITLREKAAANNASAFAQAMDIAAEKAAAQLRQNFLNIK